MPESGEIAEKVEELLEAVRGSREYRDYQETRKVIRANPEKLHAVQEFRRERYALQCSTEDIDLYNETDKLEQKYSFLTEDPLIAAYLDAESAFFKIIRAINYKLISDLDIEDTLDE